MPKPRTTPLSAPSPIGDLNDVDPEEELERRRKAVLLRMLAMAKPWRLWVIISNICIIISSFLGVFSLLAIIPILTIIFSPETAAPGAKKVHAPAGAAQVARVSENDVSKLGAEAILKEHEAKYEELVTREDAPTSNSHSLWAQIRHIPHTFKTKRQELEEWTSIQAVLHPMPTVYWICGVYLLVALVSSLLDYASDLCINHVETQFLGSLTRKLYRHCLTHDLAFYNKYPLGTMLNRVYNDILKMRSILDLMYGTKFRQPVTLVFATLMLFAYNWQMASIIILSVPFLIIPALLIAKRIRAISRSETGVDSTVMQVMEEQLGGARLIKMFGAEDQEMTRFEKVNTDMYRRRWRRGLFTDLNDPVMDFLIALGLVLVILFGVKAVLVWHALGIDGKSYVFFIVVLSRFYSPLKDLTGMNVDIQRPLMSAEAIFRMLDYEPRLHDAPDAVALAKPWHTITFRDLWFRYGRNSPYVLRNINLTLRAGESVAILGHNGSGKTTLSSLMYRFYDPVSGRIEIDGTDLRKIRGTDLRHEFGNVGQHALLFNVSITENIAFGVALEKIDHDRVLWAARQTGADAFIRELTSGYDTLVGRHGNQLSGGQRQLITLARVYYHRFSLIVYDEPTTHLDLEAEEAVTRCMHELRGQHTVVLITHNLQHALGFDRVVLMQAGEIVQDAPPDQIDTTLLRRLEHEQTEAPA